MTDTQDWRSISPEVAEIVTSIITKPGLSGCDKLLADLPEAIVSPQTAWILDIKSPASSVATEFADGPFPARPFDGHGLTRWTLSAADQASHTVAIHQQYGAGQPEAAPDHTVHAM